MAHARYESTEVRDLDETEALLDGLGVEKDQLNDDLDDDDIL